MFMFDYGMHGWGMAFGWLIPVGFLVVFFYLLKGKQTPSAKDILDHRYAKGEIDTNEYRERLRELGYTGKKDEND